MIGSWDNSNCVFLLAPICLKQGSNPAAFNSGNTSFLYLGASAGGTEIGDLTNMGSGYGYTTNGDCKHDAANDFIAISNLSIPITNAYSFSYFTRIYIDVFSSTGYSYFFTSKPGTQTIAFDHTTSTGKIRLIINHGTARQILSTALTLLDGWHTIGCIKDGASMKVYCDNVDVSDGTVTYDQGDFNYGANTQILARSDDPGQGVPNAWWRWAAFYNNARSAANISADHTNADTFYGLLGYSDAPGTDEVFDSLVDPTPPAGDIVIPVFMNQYRQRRR